MIDLDKEEFLQRLDIRLVAISGMLAYHEKYTASVLCNQKQYRDVEKRIEQTSRDFIDYIFKTDKEIRENFERIKKELTEETE